MYAQKKLIEEIIGEDRSKTVAKWVFISGVSVLVLCAMPFALRQTAVAAPRTRLISGIFEMF